MTWLVFAVSGLLVLAGAVAISSGAPYVQLERGWTEVISGAVAMSSGGVVFALGVILMRLESLRDAMVPAPGAPLPVALERSLPSNEAAAFPVAAAPEAAHPEPVAAAVADELAPEPHVAAPEEVPSNQGLWKRIRRPDDSAAVTRLEAGGFPDRILSEPEAPPAPAVPQVPSDGTIEHSPAPEPVSTPPLAPARAYEDTGQLGWLDRSLMRSRPADAPRQEPRVEPALHGLGGDPAAIDSHDGDQRTEPALDMSHAVPADEGPTVIGRYQAGVASYVMYSDGTIEVETESGQSHRFNSMDELKAFIAKQDGAGG